MIEELQKFCGYCSVDVYDNGHTDFFCYHPINNKNKIYADIKCSEEACPFIIWLNIHFQSDLLAHIQLKTQKAKDYLLI